MNPTSQFQVQSGRLKKGLMALPVSFLLPGFGRSGLGLNGPRKRARGPPRPVVPSDIIRRLCRGRGRGGGHSILLHVWALYREGKKLDVLISTSQAGQRDQLSKSRNQFFPTTYRLSVFLCTQGIFPTPCGISFWPARLHNWSRRIEYGVS